MEIKSRIIPAKPRNKELYFLKGTGGTVISGSSGTSSYSPPTYWELITVDNEGNPLAEPYLKTEYTAVSEKGLSALGLGEDGDEGGGGTEYILPTASTTVLGGVKVGQRLSISNGVLSADVQSDNYSLPTASATTLGGIKVGDGLTISSGVLSVVGGGGGSTVTWGTESGGYVPLIVEGVSKSVALSTHTHSQYALTTHNHSGVYEPVFTKNDAFNKNFGTVAGTVMQGNDSRVHSHANKLILDQITQSNIDVLAKLSIVDGNIKADTTLWSTGGISALGLGSGGGSGGGVDMLDSWTTYTTEKADYYAPASLLVPFRNDTLSRLTSLEEGGGAIDIDIANVIGLQTALNGKEPSFTKNTAFNKNFGTAVGTVAQGNDSRINNGQTAFGWGNHSSAGYALNSVLTTHTGNTTVHITATERTNWNDADSKKHTHTNKTVLDGITSSLVSNWNTAYTNNHTHTNKTIIDKLTQGNIDVLSKLSIDASGNLKIDTNAYATGGVSALGLGEGGGSSGGGADMLDSWANYTAVKANYYVPASLLVPFYNNYNSHGHTIGNVTGLQSALDSKVDDSQVLTNVPAGAKFTDTTYSAATTAANGLMSAADKVKLNGIATEANKYVHPTGAGNNHIPTGGATGQFLKWSASGVAVWAADNNTTYGAVTTSANGLMIAADKVKLDGIATGANNYVHPSGVYMSSAERTKLDGIAASANNYVHPSAHPASIITQTSSYRFVTDTEKSTWNAKATPSDISTAIDAIEIGGRNLLLDSAFKKTPLVFVAGTRVVSGNEVTVTKVGAAHYGFALRFSEFLTPNKTYTFSLWIKTTSATPFDYISLRTNMTDTFVGGAHTVYSLGAITSDGNYKKYLLTITTTLGTVNGISIATNNRGTSFTIKEPKLELGTKATDWSPAPEDELISSKNLWLGTETPITRSGGNYTLISRDLRGLISEGDTCTLQFDITTTLAYNSKVYLSLTQSINVGNMTEIYSKDVPLGKSRYNVTFSYKDISTRPYLIFYKNVATSDTAIFENLTLVKGTKAVWSPAPEDTQAKFNAKLNLTGGTMTGILTSQNNTSYTTKQVRNMILSTADASAGSMANGDIWIKYE